MNKFLSALVASFVFSYPASAQEFIHLDFDLAELSSENCKPAIDPAGESANNLITTVNDPAFWQSLLAEGRHRNDPRLDRALIVLPLPEGVQGPSDAVAALGMTAQDSLQLSGDGVQGADASADWCAEGHDQGTLNNRYCHSAIARNFANWLQRQGVDPTVASIAGGIFWVPKEVFVDLNPSAHDVAFTYTDRLGTQNTTFEITVFGDAFFPRYLGRDFAPLRSSTPFLTIRRRF